MFKWIVDFFVEKPVQEEKKERVPKGTTVIAVRTNGLGEKFYVPMVCYDHSDDDHRYEQWKELYFYVNKETQEGHVTIYIAMPCVFERQVSDYKDEEKAKRIIDIYLEQEYNKKMNKIVKVDYVRYP